MSTASWRESTWHESAEARSIFEAIEPIAAGFRERGHDLYLVGGVVRDLMLGRDKGLGVGKPGLGGDLANDLVNDLVNDVDLTTDALPEVTKSLLQPSATALWTQGERFGTIGATVNELDLEITTYRAESYDSTSRKPQVAFGDDLEVDLSRRDFSINAMAVDATTGELIDPFRGERDLADRVLRTPLDPSISFTDDPLRMMRAARFIPRFELDVAPELAAAVTEHVERLAIVSAERIHDEFERLLRLASPALGFAFLSDTGLMAQVAPELAVDRWELASARASVDAEPLVRRAAFCATIGDGAESFLRERRYSAQDRTTTMKICDAARAIADDPRRFDASTTDEAVDSVLRRLVHRVGLERVPAVFETAAVLGVADEVVDRATHRVAAVGQTEDLTDFSAPIDGAEVIAVMELEPGPEVGAVVAKLLEHRLEHGPFSADEARRLLREWRG